MSAAISVDESQPAVRDDSPVEESGVASLAPEQLLVLAALAAAVAGQGGYYLGPRVAVTLLLVAAAIVYLRRPGHLGRLRSPVMAALAALAAWAFVSSTVAGHPAASLPTISVMGGIAAVVLVMGGAPIAQRHRLAHATIALGAATAVTGWIGVAFRVTRWASLESGLWRATTSVTYTNAAAAVMAALALLALAMLVGRSTLARRAAALMLVVGVATTLSRAGIIGLALGYCALLGLLGVRRVIRTTAGSMLGAVIAVVALAPSMPGTSGRRPGWAILGLLLGLAVAIVPPLTGRRATNLAMAVTAVAVVAVGLVIGAHRAPSSVAGWGERVSVSSPSRVNETHAAVAMVAKHPLVGVGPGQAVFLWTTPNHRLMVDRYAHDEYLQVAAETGLIGAAFLVVLLAAIAHSAVSGRRTGGGSMWTGAVVGLVYLGGHSAFDFLWHVPIVTLVAAVLIGLSSAVVPEQLSLTTNASQEAK